MQARDVGGLNQGGRPEVVRGDSNYGYILKVDWLGFPGRVT